MKRQAATQLLLSILATGPRPVAVIRKAAKEAAISWRTLEQVKADLGVVSIRKTTGNRGKGSWVWRLKTITPGGVRSKAVVDAPPVRPQTAVTDGSRRDGKTAGMPQVAPGEDSWPDPFAPYWAVIYGEKNRKT